jgi:polysaccharide pyruvyl transferase WcaK-like protein
MKKVGLLDQYTGANLGDAAILEAAIHNVLARHPDAEVCLFALNPEESARRHGVMCYPIAGFRLSWYSDFLREAEAVALAKKATSGPPQISAARRWVHGRPMLRRILKGSRGFALGFIRALRNVGTEAAHIVRMYRLLKGFDVLVISGGGQIDDDYGGAWGHPYTLFKFALLTRVTNTTLVYWSVGVCALRFALSHFFVKYALAPAVYRSYRDPGSKALLEGLRFTRSDPFVPDLAFSYVPREEALARPAVAGRVTIAVSPIGYLSKDWPKRDPRYFDSYRREFIEFVAGLASQDYAVVLCTSDDMDLPILESVYSALAADQRTQVRNNVRKADTRTLDRLVKCIGSVDFVVASRLHGILLAHVVGKPVLAISYDRKVDAHMSLLGQETHVVDIHRPDAKAWLSAFGKLAQDRIRVEAKVAERCAAFRAAVVEQYDRTLSE